MISFFSMIIQGGARRVLGRQGWWQPWLFERSGGPLSFFGSKRLAILEHWKPGSFWGRIIKIGVLKLLGRVQALATLPDLKVTSEWIMGYLWHRSYRSPKITWIFTVKLMKDTQQHVFFLGWFGTCSNITTLTKIPKMHSDCKFFSHQFLFPQIFWNVWKSEWNLKNFPCFRV